MIRGGRGAEATPKSSHDRQARFSRFVTSTKYEVLRRLHIQLGTLLVADYHHFFAAAFAHLHMR